MAKFPTDRGHFKEELSSNLIIMLSKTGSCQPKDIVMTAKGKEIHPSVYYHTVICIVYNWYASNYSNLHYLLLFC